MKKSAIILCWILITNYITAENFEWKTQVDSVPGDGFYKILLSPDVVWATNLDYSDIRIFDSGHREIPYIFYEATDLKIKNELYSEVPLPIISQVDSPKAKRSYVKLVFTHPYEIGKLELRVEGPNLYFRNCLLGIENQKRNKLIFEEIGWFNVSSKDAAVWEFSAIRTDQLNIIIENLDNAPLRIKQVKAYQQNKYLLVNLSSNNKYELVYGQKDIDLPKYDLKYFADSITSDLPVIKTGKPVKLDVSAPTKTVVFNKTILWIIIGAVILLLGGLSIRLAGEMGKRK